MWLNTINIWQKWHHIDTFIAFSPNTKIFTHIQNITALFSNVLLT